MTLEEIKTAIEKGKKVYWKHKDYKVIKDNTNQYLIIYKPHDEIKNCIGLTWRDEKTMNGKEEDFFIE